MRKIEQAKTKNIDSYQKMFDTSVYTLLLHYALPSIIGMIVISLYSLADSFFVADLGTSASAAVGIVFPIHAMIQALGYTLGMGAGSIISRSLGKCDIERVRICSGTAFWLSLFGGGLLCLAGLMFPQKIVRILGASEDILPYALSYVRYLFLAAPIMSAVLVISQLLRAEGHPVRSMFGLLIGSLLNILLDTLFIKTWGFGISGASLATLISQIVSLLILLSAYFSKRSQLSLRFSWSKRMPMEILNILTTGLPSTFRQGLIVLSTILLNHACSLWGDAAVASVSIVTRLFLIAFSVCLGIGQGMMPLVGFYYGCEKGSRARKAFCSALISSSVLMLLISIPMIWESSSLIALFRKDADVIAIGSAALRAQCLVLFTHGSVTCTIMALQAIGKKFYSTLLACGRQGVFFLPLFFLLPMQFGISSIIYVQPLADALTFLAGIPLLFLTWRTLKKMDCVSNQNK